MNNNQDNERQIVNPESVDLNRVQVNQDDNMLNRERANIVSASIQANDAIDEKKALDVNNEIKIKKVNPVVKIIAVIFAFLLAIVGVYYVLKLVNKIMTYDDEPTTTTTKEVTTPTSKIAAYTKDTSKVRKYQSPNRILILSPLIAGELKYINIEINDTGVINSVTGAYNIIEEGISSDKFTLIYGEDALLNGDERLVEFDTEIKSYRSKDNNIILIVNGTPKYEYAFYINGSTVEHGKFIETENSITLESGLQFTKENIDVSVNGALLEYVY